MLIKEKGVGHAPTPPPTPPLLPPHLHWNYFSILIYSNHPYLCCQYIKKIIGRSINNLFKYVKSPSLNTLIEHPHFDIVTLLKSKVNITHSIKIW